MRLKTAYGPMTVTPTEFERIKPLRTNETAKRALVLTKQILGGTVIDVRPVVDVEQWEQLCGGVGDE